MLSPFVVDLALLLSAATASHAVMVPSSATAGQSIPLHRRTPPSRTEEEWGIWAKDHRDRLIAKYEGEQGKPQKRNSGTNL